MECAFTASQLSICELSSAGRHRHLIAGTIASPKPTLFALPLLGHRCSLEPMLVASIASTPTGDVINNFVEHFHFSGGDGEDGMCSLAFSGLLVPLGSFYSRR
jgi:hypothetical protein